MTIEFSISTVTFSGGTRVPLKRGSVVALVGPTNAGKTASLRDIASRLASEQGAASARVVRDVTFDSVGDVFDLERWVEQNADRVVESPPGIPRYRRMGVTESIATLSASWRQKDSGFIGPALSQFLVLYADVDNRAGVVSQTANPMSFADSSPSTPIAHLYRDGALEERFNKISSDVFGESITLQRLGGQLALRVGVPAAPVPPLNRPTREYADDEAALPMLSDQGHGMRSFLGLVLLLLTRNYPVYLIDEPEVFLHPPQRRALGRLISKLSRDSGSQIVVATHDADVLLGLLDGSSQTEVVRLTRSDKVNYARQIDGETIQRLWADPLLRHSKLFDGLFYQRVVICESDSDCQFYSAVLDHLVEDGAIARPDVLFVPAYTKDRVHVALAALRCAGVDVRAALDFDVLRNDVGLKRLIDSAGGSWEDFQSSWTTFAPQISSKKLAKPISALRKELDDALPSDGDLDRATSKRLVTILKYSDGWDEAKATGLRAVPRANATVACTDTLARLETLGIFVSREGELESFVREVPGHGPAWVAEVITRDLHKTAKEAHAFVKRLVG